MMKYILCVVTLLSLIQVSSQTQLSAYVNPFIGTGGHGHTFPGAIVPFGMVQLSPDTRVDGSWDGCSGYNYSDSIIYGFSHTHLNGTGVSDYGDIMMMPVMNSTSFDQKDYATPFSHANEKANAGFYEVKLNNGINVALTTSARVGFHKYTFPTHKNCGLILDLTHRDQLVDGSITIINSTTIAVKRVSKAWATNQHAYAYIVFSKPFVATFNKEKNKVHVAFKLKKKEELLCKVGFSFVSVEGAEKNLKAEIPHWNFNQVKEDANQLWNNELSKIIVSDFSTEKLTIFYTALYHVMTQPNVAMDVDGNYRGMDNKIHKAEGFTYYTIFSLWDTFRAAHPLMTIIDQKRTLDFIKTFLAHYQQGGRLPVWELASNETDCMIGYHSVSVITDAYKKGITDFDVTLAYEAMKKSATWNHLGLPAYQKHGFLSIDDEHESVSKTLEYAYDDWCIAQMALALNNSEDYPIYTSRSESWKNLFDPETSLMRPRKNGNWITPFDPKEVNNHFTEGNSWQYSFFVPQDIPGLIRLVGGKAKMEQLLDQLFTENSQTTGRTQVDITGLIGQYAHGNEPSHHIAFLYNYIGKSEKTVQRVHQILGEFYTSKPDGLIGNEDCGQMSAWYVMASLGLYAVTPGLPEYTVTKPYFSQYEINLENGNKITEKTVETVYASNPEKKISHFKLMGETKKMDSPLPYILPNFIRGPIIKAVSNSFQDSLLVELVSNDFRLTKYRTIAANGKTSEWQEAKSFYIKENVTIEAVAFDTKGESKPVRAHFFKVPHPDWHVHLISKPNPQYFAGGAEGLIDGIKGNENWRKGDWHGYQGQDFETLIVFPELQTIHSISVSFLQDSRSWILMPTRVEFFTSENGLEYQQIGFIDNTLSPEEQEVKIQELSKKMDYKVDAKFVKIKAYNYGKLPTWHQGAGFDAFIFVDEVTIK
jgi:predicted alpha-1,2-mannosidase